MKRILYITNIPTPYRTAFFNMIGKEYDLTVWYEYSREPNENRDSSWERDNAVNYRAVYSFKLKDINCFDLIVVCGISTPKEIQTIIYLKMFRIPYCIEVDGGYPKVESYLKYRIKKFLMSGANAYLSTAKMTDEYLLRYGAAKEAIYRTRFSSVLDSDVINHCPSIEEKTMIRKKLGLNDCFTVLYVGRFLDWKGIDVLLHAVSGLNGLNVVLIGGKLPFFLQTIIDENRIDHVNVIDFVEPALLNQYYQAADVFVFPSRNDIWGLVVNEALANGLPVISSTRSIAGLELVETGKNGFIFPVDDVEQLRHLIAFFIRLEDNKKRAMGENAIQTAHIHTIETMVEDHIRVFEVLLRGRFHEIS